MKRPAFQFYPADWRKDAALQSCSVAAQGLWINVMCIAHECDPYGHLTVNGKPMSSAQISRLVGLTVKDCDKLLAELSEAGVSDVAENGAICSRRMVRDEDIRNRRAAGGKEGAEHGSKGAEHGKKGGRPPNGRGDNKPPLYPPPSSSSSSSPSGKDSEPDGSDAAAAPAASKPKSTDEMAKAELWRAAVSVLEQGGCPPSQCRTFMGKLVGDYTFPLVERAVASAVANQPADAREYLKATCLRLKGERTSPLTVPSDAAEQTKALLASYDMTPDQKAAADAARAIAMKSIRPINKEAA